MATLSKDQPIGIWDSGAGGLTVMQEIARLLPHENVVYFGDTARIPYGGKSRDTIIRYSIENTIFLMEHNIKALVVACNTGVAHAFDRLQQIFKIPIIGVIDPGAEKAVEMTKSGRIAVMGTKGLVHSGAYQKEIMRRLPRAVVTGIPCPLIVPIVEECFFGNPISKMIIKHYLADLHVHEVDTLLLGCTHYPVVRHLIEEVLDKSISIVDPAKACAENVADLLTKLQLRASHRVADYKYFVSDDTERFRSIGKVFSDLPIENIELARSER
jgi:glutamate racemase